MLKSLRKEGSEIDGLHMRWVCGVCASCAGIAELLRGGERGGHAQGHELATQAPTGDEDRRALPSERGAHGREEDAEHEMRCLSWGFVDE